MFKLFKYFFSRFCYSYIFWILASLTLKIGRDELHNLHFSYLLFFFCFTNRMGLGLLQKCSPFAGYVPFHICGVLIVLFIKYQVIFSRFSVKFKENLFCGFFIYIRWTITLLGADTVYSVKMQISNLSHYFEWVKDILASKYTNFLKIEHVKPSPNNTL